VDSSGHPTHIVMREAPDGDKYASVHRHLTLADCLRHLAGRVTVGSYLTTTPGGDEARIICRDADNPAAFVRLMQAAPLLRGSGASPHIETTHLPDDHPHAGGGKLWIPFDQPVNWRHAQGTAVQVAPMLEGLEAFSPGRVRLPGGRYRNGVDTWAELSAYGAADDSWYTSHLAIETMMENLTPAAWVRPVALAFARQAHRPRLPAVIHEGEGRNTWMAKIACSLRHWGIAPAVILEALRPVNQSHCQPPLDDDELRRIAHGMARYAPASPRPAEQRRRRRYG
jgi:hypothetical protein